MAKNISSKEYWAEVEALANRAVQEAEQNDADLDEVVHEMVDGHQWVIYTAYNYDVLKHTDSDEDIEEAITGTAGGQPESWHGLLMQASYIGMSGDVVARAERFLELDEDEDEDE